MKKILISIVLVTLILPAVALGQDAPPSLPLLIYGDVTLYDSPAPIGTIVSIEKDSTEITRIVLTTAGKYSTQIPSSYSGSLLSYKVDGTLVTQKIAANPMTTGSDRINLTFGSAPSGGGGGGGGGASLSSAKAISSFTFSSPISTGVINETNHTVTLSVSGTTDVTALVPTIIISASASVSPNSGIAQNFTNPVSYTVTAQDGTTQIYVVTVGKVLGTVTPHSNGTLIVDNGTVYLITNGQRRGFRDTAEYLSYGFDFASVQAANSGDAALPAGAILKAMDGTLALDTSDGRTVYVIGNNGTKRGFVSEAVFLELGYKFSQAVQINLADYTVGDPITSASVAHPDGTLVISGQTIWWINNGQRHGFTSMEVFNSYGWTIGKVLNANSADMALPEGSVLQPRSEALAQGTWLL
ncbi:MAG: DUF5018 domain-containing protein [Bacteroidota bacterium]